MVCELNKIQLRGHSESDFIRFPASIPQGGVSMRLLPSDTFIVVFSVKMDKSAALLGGIASLAFLPPLAPLRTHLTLETQSF